MWVAIGKVHSGCSLYAEVQSIRCTTRTPGSPLHTVYALTFAVFVDQQPSAKDSSRENLDHLGLARVCVCKTIASQKCKKKNDGDSLGQRDMQLRTSTEATDYINTTRIQRKR